MSRAFAILQAIEYEMKQNPLMVYSRQGRVGAATRPDGASINLVDEFGIDRALARLGQGIDEDWMTNSTVGYALTGAPSIVELPGMTPIYPVEYVFNQMAAWTHMSGGRNTVNMVLICGGSGRAPGRGQQHDLAGTESIYAFIPGLKVVVPHTVYDAKGLMHAAIRDKNPVVFFNYSTQASADIPDEPFVVPIGKAEVLKEGTNITIATWGAAHTEVAKAVGELDKAGIKAEYISVRTLKPFDEATLNASVSKTGALLVVSEGQYTGEFSSHVLAVACQAVRGAKFHKITFPDAHGPGSKPMNEWMRPLSPRIVDAAEKLIRS